MKRGLDHHRPKPQGKAPKPTPPPPSTSRKTDIKVLEKGDKLIVKMLEPTDPSELMQIHKELERFMNDEKMKSLVMSNEFDVYIMKGGAKISLEEEVGKMKFKRR